MPNFATSLMTKKRVGKGTQRAKLSKHLQAHFLGPGFRGHNDIQHFIILSSDLAFINTLMIHIQSRFELDYSGVKLCTSNFKQRCGRSKIKLNRGSQTSYAK